MVIGTFVFPMSVPRSGMGYQLQVLWGRQLLCSSCSSGRNMMLKSTVDAGCAQRRCVTNLKGVNAVLRTSAVQ